MKPAYTPVLPPELWLHIASFVPPRDLRYLIGLNRLFFNLIMNELYSQLSFISADPRIFADKLASLQGPKGSLAERVRALTIWPSAVRDALTAPVPARAKPKTERTHTRTGSDIIKRSRDYVEDLFLFKNPKSIVPVPWVLPPSRTERVPSPEARLKMFTEAIEKLTRVEECEIAWYVDHGASGPDGGGAQWTFSHFPIIWQSIGASLRVLSIDAQLFKMGDIVLAGSAGSLPKIEELNLTLRNEIGADQTYNTTVIPYFINKLSKSLQSLSIKTIGHQSFAFFRLLGRFPLLTSLSLSLPLDAVHITDPAGLQQVFHNHPGIRHLSLRYARCCRDAGNDGFQAELGRHLLYGGVSLPVLQSLELGLHLPIPSGYDTAGLSMLSSVSRITDNLSTLSLKDRSLTLAEARTVFRAFNGAARLKKLSMYVKYLSPQMVDLVAGACPVLSIWEVDVEAAVMLEEHKAKDDVAVFADALLNHAIDLDNDEWRYRTWTLADISVLKWEFKVGHQYSWACMKAIADVVPSVRSFAGRGDMLQIGDGDQAMRMVGPVKRRMGELGLEYGERGKPWDT